MEHFLKKHETFYFYFICKSQTFKKQNVVKQTKDLIFWNSFLIKKTLADAKRTTPYFLGPTFIGIIIKFSDLFSQIRDLHY